MKISKKLIKILIILLIIILVIISGSIIYFFKKEKNNNGNDDTYHDNNVTQNRVEENNQTNLNNNTDINEIEKNETEINKIDTTPVVGDLEETQEEIWGENTPITQEDLKIQIDETKYTYFLIKQCMNKFYSSRENAYNILAEELKQQNNLNFYPNSENIQFCIDNIYKVEPNKRKNIYIIHYRLKSNNLQNISMIIKIDKKELAFEVYPFEFLRNYGLQNLKENDYININVIKLDDINRTEYNNYNIDEISKDDLTCVNEIFNKYKFDLNFDNEHLYSIIEKEYKDSKFPSYNDFVNYLNNHKDYFADNMVKYQTIKLNNYTEYVSLGEKENRYYFYMYSLTNFTVMFDNYTISVPQYSELYQSSFPTVRAKYCIDRVRKAINDKNYQFIYKRLNPIQKNNYFSSYEDFERFIKDNFYDENTFEYEEYLIVSDTVYQYKVKVTDTTKKLFSYRRFNMSITLKDDEEFYISINKYT